MADIKDSQIKAYTFAVGNYDPLNKNSRAAMRIINKQEGLIGIQPRYPLGTLLCFVTENDAKIARNRLDFEGIKTGSDICECFVEKKYVPKKFGGEL